MVNPLHQQEGVGGFGEVFDDEAFDDETFFDEDMFHEELYSDSSEEDMSLLEGVPEQRSEHDEDMILYDVDYSSIDVDYSPIDDDDDAGLSGIYSFGDDEFEDNWLR